MRDVVSYCSIARASEVVAQPWTPIILRNLLVGSSTFTELAACAPGMSRSLLSTRLRQLQRNGLITAEPNPRRKGRVYSLTEAGRGSQNLTRWIFPRPSWRQVRELDRTLRWRACLDAVVPEATIRPYHPGDRDACRALWVELTEWHREIYASPGIGGDDPGSKFDEHLARVGPGSLWVAEVDGEVVGLAGLMEREDGELEVEPTVVAAGHRRAGIGRRLIAEVVAAARERGESVLNVRPVGRNAEAIRFYRAVSFDVVGHVELFIDLRDDEGPWRDGEEIAGRRFRV